MNNEIFPSSHENSLERAALESEGQKERERLREALETRAEQSKQERESAPHETLRAEALERASRTKEISSTPPATPEHQRGPITKKQRDESFERTMRGARSDMSPVSRAFSKAIHNKSVEAASDGIGKTIARPNAILTASIFAFLFTAVTLYIARYYGYVLSGFESIGAFIIGWAVGIVYDILRNIVRRM